MRSVIGRPRDLEASDGLYEADFYAWTQRQALLLKKGDLERLDAPNILEEIETLGRKEVSELRARLRILSAHLLKEMYQPAKSTRSRGTTILNQRIAIADHIEDNPSLRPKLADAFAKSYQDARELAASETGLSTKVFPPEPPFSCDDAISRSWLPKATVAPARTKD